MGIFFKFQKSDFLKIHFTVMINAKEGSTDKNSLKKMFLVYHFPSQPRFNFNPLICKWSSKIIFFLNNAWVPAPKAQKLAKLKEDNILPNLYKITNVTKPQLHVFNFKRNWRKERER